jgi:hypothetical protein
MPIEMYGSDEAGHLMLMPDPTPERPPDATAPPEGEPPLPGADAAAAVDTAPDPSPPPPDDLAALRRLIEEREQARAVQDARRDAQFETMTRVFSGAAPELPQAPAQPTGPPQAEQFASHEDYVMAAARYGAQQEFQARDQQTAQQRQQDQQIRFQQDLMQREQTFKAEHSDFDTVVRGGLAGKVSPILQQALMIVPDGPAVAYALARQPDLVQRLNQMPPPLVLVELGRLSPPSVATSPPSGGSPGQGPPSTEVQGGAGRPKPPPLRPLSGTGVAPVGGYRDDMSMPEYRQWKKQNNL